MVFGDPHSRKTPIKLIYNVDQSGVSFEVGS